MVLAGDRNTTVQSLALKGGRSVRKYMEIHSDSWFCDVMSNTFIAAHAV